MNRIIANPIILLSESCIIAYGRPVTFSSRDKLAPGALVSKDTLLLNESENVKQVRVAIADVLLPGTLPAALEGNEYILHAHSHTQTPTSLFHALPADMA